TSFPIQSGHGCLGCSEQDFWDQGSFYDRITNIPQLGTNTTAQNVGLAAIGGIGGAVAVHGVATMLAHGRRCKNNDDNSDKSDI
ncbi:MAG: [Ni/Fe] hydrogenase small subunit, partial [Desulfovibrionaceae bacterium]